MPADHPSRPTPPAPARAHRRLAVALAAGCALLAAGVAATPVPAAPRCDPPGPPLSATVARDAHPDGTAEVTEYLPRGEYRVTRCSRDGRPQISETVSPILDPDGAIALVTTKREEPGAVMEALYGDPTERTWADDFRASRAARRATTPPPTVPSPVPATAVAPSVPEPAAEAPGRSRDKSDAEGLTARAAVAGDACTNGQYAHWLGAWTSRNYGYTVNRGRFNWNNNTVTSLIVAHTNWDRTSNSCGLADVTILNSWYLGSTASTIHTYADGQSVIDRGPMASVGCAGALACTFVFTNGAGTITETDQRYSDAVTFSNVGAAGAYDYQSVGTHEAGHSIGLHHANSSDALTMFYSVRAGTTHARSLAKGDVMGLRTRYP
ncbi:MAG: matrixin family metalloprotease [Solirubrobacteraceae bacterium]|nr:matrixin family metalloprotease [Solirubrobacteraceae bacterium]